MRTNTGLVLLAMVALGLSGCSDDSGGSSITVLAAASLTDTFPVVAKGLHGGEVRFSFGGSSALAEQVRSGAPADVIATASSSTMSSVADLVDEPRTFARNTVVIAVPAGNPAGVTGLADFARSDLRIVVCAAKVPCGAAAATAFQKAGVTARPDSTEPDVRAVLTKAQLGEADAAIVYRTDVRGSSSSGKVQAIELPESQRVTTDYQVAVVKATGNRELAEAFVAETTSEAGRKALTDAGFDLP